jgi:hypothetical protein
MIWVETEEEMITVEEATGWRFEENLRILELNSVHRMR